jgi:type I protein arginine methyltransferase
MTTLLEFHAFLLSNTGTRLERFARAMAAVIRPGDVVLDLGAGSGILSILACRAGARRVYAVEQSDSVTLAEHLLAGTPERDRIDIIHAPSFDITLPEAADVIVADVHSIFGLQERGLSAMLDARARLLKAGGQVLPARIELHVAPAEAPDVYMTKVDHWRGATHGVSLEPVRTLAVNNVHSARLTPPQLLAAPVAICSVDILRASGLHLGGRVQMEVARAGTLHGLCGGMVTTLADRVEISNLPGDASSNFAHAFLPLDTPVPVAAGDALDIQIDAYDGDEMRWQVAVTSAASGATRRFAHSTFLSRVFSRDELRKRDPAYTPTLTPQGRLERDLLQRIDGGTTRAALEEWLMAEGGGALTRERLAELLVTTLARCG